MFSAGPRGLRPAVRLVLTLLPFLLLLTLLPAWGAPRWQTEVVSPRPVRLMRPMSAAPLPDLAVSGQVLIQAQPGVSTADLRAALEAKGCRLLKRYRLGSLALVKLPAGTSVPDGLALVRTAQHVRAASPDRLCYPLRIPNDPRYDEQWHWPLISAPQGWDVQTGRPTTVVAIVDSGIQTNHPDLAAKIWVNPNPGSDPRYPDDIHGWNFIDNNNDINPIPVDGEPNANVGHGTHVAGLVGAATNNRLGVAGADWQCRLMGIKIFDHDEGSPNSLIIEGFEYAVTHGAHVINMSLGGGWDPLWTAPITDAFEQGVVVVCAVGNSSVTFTSDPDTWFSPACNDGEGPDDNHVLGVAACGPDKQIAWYSNLDGSGRRLVDVVAPGGALSGDPAEDLLSTWPFFPGFPEFGEYYYAAAGTSMACPVAAGVAALVRAQYPSADPATVINLIRAGCTSLDAENPDKIGLMGAGLLNLAGALTDLPPGPARNVRAFDTVGDSGGSITVTWTRSVDDGAGFNDVVSYDVLRADQAGGPFTVLATLPAGSTTYVDTPVPDGVSYWYRIDTHDAKNVTPSAEAGPAQARDDLPPPPVTTLTAQDTPNDQGGSITLAWAGYDPPADFASFRLYRATAAFTSVSGMSPLATLADREARGYVDNTTVDGTDYWYAVTAVDTSGNEDKSVSPTGPVQSFPNLSLTIPPGLSMIALPLVPTDTDMGRLLGIVPGSNIRLARYDPSTRTYVQYEDNPASPFLRQALGRAFWVRTPTALTVALSGLPAPPGDFRVDLTPGWQMIGNPFSADLRWGDSVVTVGGTPEDLDTSNSNGHTANYAWVFDTTGQSYRLVSAALTFASRVIPRGAGVFFRSRVVGTLTLKRPTGALQVTDRPAAPAPTADNWVLRLVARTDQAADTDNFLGISPQAAELNGVVAPPMPEGGVDLAFLRGAEQAPTATSFQAPGAAAPTWDLQVATAQPGTEVTLSWPDLTTVPNSVRPILTDLTTNRSVYMRTTNEYRFRAGRSPRRFRVSLAGEGTVMLTSVTAATAAGRAEITYALSAPAQVSVEVLNLSGHLVRGIGAGSLSPAGVNTVVWDGRNTGGAAVPAGLYLIRVTAESDNGQRASVVRALSLRR